MRRIAAIVACCCAAVPAIAAGAGGSSQSWAKPQIQLVTRDGVAQSTPVDFAPDAPLTAGALAGFVSRLTDEPKAQVPDLAAPVSLSELDGTLVDALGLRDTAYRFYRAAAQAGLRPPARFGSESVARLLGLRVNHPDGQDDLELQPQQTATRAEAAFSLATILGFQGEGERNVASTQLASPDFASSWQVQNVKADAATFALPDLTPWQRRILTTAISYVGYPYVWGGTLDHAAGFDCSGFVWQVYKLTSYPDDGDLANVLRGRTTMEMSGEVSAKERISFANLQPGDVLFFGSGPHSKPAQVDHAGIYLGNGWFVNSSGYGVAIAPLTGWYRSSFAWARRPLAEAGLT